MSKRNRITLIILAGVLLLITGLFLARGWIRGAAVPKIVGVFHSRTVKNRFVGEFSPLEGRLKEFGLNFSEESLESRRTDCKKLGYQGLGVTVSCTISAGSNSIHPDEDYKQNWREHSANLDKSLTESGWALQPSSHKIVNLLDLEVAERDPYASYSTHFNRSYYKEFGGFDRCWLSFVRRLYPEESFPGHDPNGDFEVSVNCLSYVKVFGGY